MKLIMMIIEVCIYIIIIIITLSMKDKKIILSIKSKWAMDDEEGLRFCYYYYCK